MTRQRITIPHMLKDTPGAQKAPAVAALHPMEVIAGLTENVSEIALTGNVLTETVIAEDEKSLVRVAAVETAEAAISDV